MTWAWAALWLVAFIFIAIHNDHDEDDDDQGGGTLIPWLSHLPDNLNRFLRHKEMVTDLWEDMSTLNSLYEELCWDPDEELEFKPDFANDCIVIRRKEKE